MNLKIAGVIYNATIRRNVSKGKKEVVLLDKVEEVKSLEKKLGSNNITMKQVQDIAQENEKKKAICMKVHKPGDRFKITILKVIEDKDPQEPLLP